MPLALLLVNTLFRYRDNGARNLPMACRAYQENHDILVRRLLGNGAVRVGDLGSVFPNPNIVHVRVLDVAHAHGSSVDDLSDQECKCGQKSIAKGEDESDERLRAGAGEEESRETEIVTKDFRHRIYGI